MPLTKTNQPGYMKDTQTSLVVNTNTNELAEYNAHKARIKKERAVSEELGAIRSELKSLSDEVAMLQHIIKDLADTKNV